MNRERGVTVILTTHDMHDIEALAKRVILIGKGEVLFDGDFDALLARSPETSVEAAMASVYGEMGLA
jgi:ABC-type uncharacterized transport system ATPase subunit